MGNSFCRSGFERKSWDEHVKELGEKGYPMGSERGGDPFCLISPSCFECSVKGEEIWERDPDTRVLVGSSFRKKPYRSSSSLRISMEMNSFEGVGGHTTIRE